MRPLLSGLLQMDTSLPCSVLFSSYWPGPGVVDRLLGFSRLSLVKPHFGETKSGLDGVYAPGPGIGAQSFPPLVAPPILHEGVFPNLSFSDFT